MKKTDRLFEIIQILRSRAAGKGSNVVTAEQLAEQLEVTVRTIYRDIAALQAMRTPIDGEAGVGYMMRSGYDLPPINFNANELEAIVIGLNMLGRTGDKSLIRAANSVASKIESVRDRFDTLMVHHWGAKLPRELDPEMIRAAIRNHQKLRISYCDESGRSTSRKILPLAMIYYIESVVVAAWCELRKDFRHFRLDRIEQCDALDVYFHSRVDRLLAQWNKLQISV